MGGYDATGLTKYKDMTETIFPAWSAKYRFGGLGAPRTDSWGYDCLNMLRSLKMAAVNNVTDAPADLATATVIYLNDYEAMAAVAGYQGDYDRIFINVIASELGIGTFQGTVDWTVIKNYNDSQGWSSVQEAAYGLMGGSWATPDVQKTYLKANICTEDNSEPVAEAIYALGL